jgi:GntR family transcriptional regulator
MFDVQHDSPVPIHEQLTGQIREHVASGALKAGARLPEHRAFAQELLANPQVVARAYRDLEEEGVLKKVAGGAMEVAPAADVICRQRLRDMARDRIREAVAQGLVWGLAEAEITEEVGRALTAARRPGLSPEEAQKAIKKPTHDSSSHRASQGIQDLSRKSRPGSA